MYDLAKVWPFSKIIFPFLSWVEQAAFSKLKQIVSPKSTGAVLCGHKQMAEV